MQEPNPVVPGPHMPGTGDGGSDGEDDSDAFRMFQYKVKQCTKVRAHDWCSCCYSHPGEKAKRRDPLTYNYAGAACPEFRRNGCCKRGDACPLAHGVFETWLHPQRYRTQMCSDGANCKRRICFFAHNESELRKLEDDPVWLQEQQQQQQQTERSAEQLGISLPRPVAQRGSLDTILSAQQQQQQQQQLGGGLGIEGVSGPRMAPFDAHFGPSSAPSGLPSIPQRLQQQQQQQQQQPRQHAHAEAAFAERIRTVISEFASQGKGLSQAQTLQVLQALAEQQEDTSRLYTPPAPAFPVLGMSTDLPSPGAAPTLFPPHMHTPTFAEPPPSLGGPPASLAGVPLMTRQAPHEDVTPFLPQQRAHSSGQVEGLPAYAHLIALQQQQQQQQALALPLELQSSQLAQQLQVLHTAQQSQWQAPMMQGAPLPAYHLGGTSTSASSPANILPTLTHPNLHALQLAHQQQPQHSSAPSNLPAASFDSPRALPQRTPLRAMSFSMGDAHAHAHAHGDRGGGGGGAHAHLPFAQRMLLMHEAQQQQQQQQQQQVVPFAGSLPLVSEQQLQQQACTMQQAQGGADELHGAQSVHSAHSVGGRRSPGGRRNGVLLEEGDVMAHVTSAPPSSGGALPLEPAVQSATGSGSYSTSELGASGGGVPTSAGSDACSSATAGAKASSSSPPLAGSPSRVVQHFRSASSTSARGSAPALSNSAEHSAHSMHSAHSVGGRVGSPSAAAASRVQGAGIATAPAPTTSTSLWGGAHPTHAASAAHAPAHSSAPAALFPQLPPPVTSSLPLSLPLSQPLPHHAHAPLGGHSLLGGGGGLHHWHALGHPAHAHPPPHMSAHAPQPQQQQQQQQYQQQLLQPAELWRLAEQQAGSGSEFARVQLAERGQHMLPEVGKGSWPSVPEQDEGNARDSSSSLELAALSLNTGNTLEGSSSIAQLSGLSRLMSSSTWAGSDASQRDSPATSFTRGLSFAGDSGTSSGLRSSSYAGTMPMSPAHQGLLGPEAQMPSGGLSGLGSFESTKHSPLQQRLMQSQLSGRSLFGTGSRSVGSAYSAMQGAGNPLFMRREGGEGASDDGALLGIPPRARAPDYGLSEEDGQKAQQTVSALLAQVTRQRQSPQGPADT